MLRGVMGDVTCTNMIVATTALQIIHRIYLFDGRPFVCAKYMTTTTAMRGIVRNLFQVRTTADIGHVMTSADANLAAA